METIGKSVSQVMRVFQAEADVLSVTRIHIMRLIECFLISGVESDEKYFVWKWFKYEIWWK